MTRVRVAEASAVPRARGERSGKEIGKGPKRERRRGSRPVGEDGETAPFDALAEVVWTRDEVEETAGGEDVSVGARRSLGAARSAMAT